jgi:hypothetical protein
LRDDNQRVHEVYGLRLPLSPTLTLSDRGVRCSKRLVLTVFPTELS